VLKGKKTVIVMAGSFLAYALGWDQLKELVDPKYIAMATAAVGFALRFITETSVWSKE
jgi:hypothetical protein